MTSVDRRLALLLLVVVFLINCNPSRPPRGTTERLVFDYLASKYLQPKDDEWYDGVTYFLPEKPGLRLLLAHPGRGEDLESLKIYRASVWWVHWGPEESYTLVGVVTRQGKTTLGILQGGAEGVSEFPDVVKGFVFDNPEERRGLALFIARMVLGFPSKHEKEKLEVSSDADCERVRSVEKSGSQLVASCFTRRGALDKIIFPQDPPPVRPIDLCEPDNSLLENELVCPK